MNKYSFIFDDGELEALFDAVDEYLEIHGEQMCDEHSATYLSLHAMFAIQVSLAQAEAENRIRLYGED